MNKEFNEAVRQFDTKDVVGRLADLNIKREEFVNHFTVDYIENEMHIDEYVVGKGKDLSNFCYALEFVLQGLGSIRGGFSSRYGVWFSPTDDIYKFNKKQYLDKDNAFLQVRKSIISLLVAGEKEDIDTIKRISLDSGFKGKILSTYFPDRYLNIYSHDSLNYFLDKLGIKYDKQSVEEKRELILDFKNSDSIMRGWSIQCFSEFLYKQFPKGPSEEVIRRRTIELEKYKKFLHSCTVLSENTIKKYINFKLINECLRSLFPKENLEVIDIVSSEYLKNIIVQLDNNEKYTTNNTNGNNMYSSSLSQYLSYLKIKEYFKQVDIDITSIASSSASIREYDQYIPAIKTKPFVLLAGISGTGKSRIVKQMAFDSCPDIGNLRVDETSPGNYQLIEVKPNWHDSSEVLGYESEIGGAHYVLTPFVKFLVKAMIYEDDAPFFVCMDEMNLAPVEQYFAEYLSVLESRKLVDGKITSEPLVVSDVFVKYEDKLKDELFDTISQGKVSAAYLEKSDEVYEQLKQEGLRLPSNLIVIGTVNMDETTHQFSRKVIDRAMTIEMNIENGDTPFKAFFEDKVDLQYGEGISKEVFLPQVVQASEAMNELSIEDVKLLKKRYSCVACQVKYCIREYTI